VVGFTNSWRYSDAGLDLGVAWRAVNYDDAGWPPVRRFFPLGSGDYPVAANTGLALEDATGTRVITYYFRTGFVLGSEVAGAALQRGWSQTTERSFPERRACAEPGNAERRSDRRDPPDEDRRHARFGGTFLIASENTPCRQQRSCGRGPSSELIRSHDIAFALELSASTFVTNDVAPSRGLVRLNELLARISNITNSSGTTPDWVELVNNCLIKQSTSAAQDITDELNSTRKWSSRLKLHPANGLMIVECDSQARPQIQIPASADAAGGVLLFHAAPAQAAHCRRGVLWAANGKSRDWPR